MPDAAPARRVWGSGRDLLFAVLGTVVILIIVAPIVALVWSSSPGELMLAAGDASVVASIRLSLLAALVATVACTIVGVPLAYVLARRTFRGKALLLALIDLPVVIPHPAAGLALLFVIGRQSPLFGSGAGLAGTFAGIAVAMVFVSAPYLVSAARGGFLAVPERAEKAARTLGASPWRVFFTVSLPLAWRDIVSGMILTWARGISEFGAVIIIAYYPMTASVMIFQRFNDYGLAHARSVAVLLILVCVSIFAVVRLLGGRVAVRGAQHA